MQTNAFWLFNHFGAGTCRLILETLSNSSNTFSVPRTGSVKVFDSNDDFDNSLFVVKIVLASIFHFGAKAI